jgi:hypothetical protein
VSVESLLTEALCGLVASIELADDDVIDPDIASTLTEPVAALLQSASRKDRDKIQELIIQASESEENPIRKEMIASIPAGFGLIEER